MLIAASIDFFCFLAGLYILRDSGNRLYLYRGFLTRADGGMEGYNVYLKHRHPIVGWPAPFQFGGEEFDKLGSRRGTVFTDPDRHPACISLYGDSFVYSEDVSFADAWGNVLAKLQNCRVNNFGIAGYGTDQAYLRYLHNKADRSPIVILGIYSDNIRRNVNQFRYFYVPHTGIRFSFKPRFILSESGLSLIPLPTIDPANLDDFSKNPETYLKHEFYIPDGLLRTKFKFPYSFALTRAAFRSYQRNSIFPLDQFYRDGHPSKGLDITAELAKQFVKTAVSRGQRPIVLVIPTYKGLRKYQEAGFWKYQRLLDRLATVENMDVLNSGEALIDALEGETPKQLFTDREKGRGHFNPSGYRLLATIVRDHINQKCREVRMEDESWRCGAKVTRDGY